MYKIEPNHIPEEAFHPGEYIKDEINFLKISQRELASKTSIHPTIINEIIKGKRDITLEYAIKFEKIAGIAAAVLLRLQKKHDKVTGYHKAKQELKRLRISPQKQKELLLAMAA